MNKKQLIIRSDQGGPRLDFILKTVLNEWLDIDFSLVPMNLGSDEEQDGIIFSYSPGESHSKHHFHADGLLLEKGLNPDYQPITDFQSLRFDPFAYIFYHLTFYPYYPLFNPLKDNHGRVLMGSNDYVLHECLDLVVQKLSAAGVAVHERKFEYEITIDVDHPWLHAHKPLLVMAGGMIKSLFSLDFYSFGQRFSSIFRGQDPNETWEKISGICPAAHTRIFFLVDGNHPNDSRFSLRLKAYREVVRKVRSMGFQAGIHPSYLSSEDEKILAKEKKLLEEAAGEVRISRQHFLRYRIPDTFRQLNQLGIKEEYSICPAETTGCLTGISLPWNFYDLGEEKMHDLKFVPSVVMDRTLQQYMKLNPENALEEIRRQIDKTRSVRGKFVIILHNETFSDTGEWKGWLEVIKKSVEYLKANES